MRTGMTRERAETIGLNGLAFLAANSDGFDRFLRLSGMEVPLLRERASEPDYLRAVLEFLLTEDALVAEFCKEHKLEARDLHLAQHMLTET